MKYEDVKNIPGAYHYIDAEGKTLDMAFVVLTAEQAEKGELEIKGQRFILGHKRSSLVPRHYYKNTQVGQDVWLYCWGGLDEEVQRIRVDNYVFLRGTRDNIFQTTSGIPGCPLYSNLFKLVFKLYARNKRPRKLNLKPELLKVNTTYPNGWWYWASWRKGELYTKLPIVADGIILLYTTLAENYCVETHVNTGRYETRDVIDRLCAVEECWDKYLDEYGRCIPYYKNVKPVMYYDGNVYYEDELGKDEFNALHNLFVQEGLQKELEQSLKHPHKNVQNLTLPNEA